MSNHTASSVSRASCPSREQMGSWLPFGIGSIADRPLGVRLRQEDGGWGQNDHSEVLPTQAIGQETTQFFLTEFLKLS